MREFLHGSNNIGYSAGPIQTLLDRPRHLVANEIQIAIQFRFFERLKDACRGLGKRSNGSAIFFEKRISGLPGFPQKRKVVAHKLGRRIDFVGNPGSQLPNSFKLLRVTQLGFERASLRDVFFDRKEVSDRTLGVRDGRDAR